MRQLFYLLMILNLLLFVWIYRSEQQPDQQQTGHPAIGDLRIVSDDVIRQPNSSDVTNDAGARLKPVLQVERKSLAPPHYLIPGVDEIHTPAGKPDAISAPLKHAPSRIIVTSINGNEVVLSSLSSYHAAASIFDQLQTSAGVGADKSMRCGDERCLFVDADEEDLFNAGLFIERDSAMMQKTGYRIDAADAHSAGE
jgi:hypothetical protein